MSIDQDRANDFVARLVKALPKRPRHTKEEDAPPSEARPIGISREQWKQQGQMNYSSTRNPSFPQYTNYGPRSRRMVRRAEQRGIDSEELELLDTPMEKRNRLRRLGHINSRME